MTKVNASEMKSKTAKKVATNITKSDDVPMFSGGVVQGNLIFIAGKGAHFDGDIDALD